ncbi:IgGFc-binding protein [Pseudenhygromyxa sp. WMMC2535]|uniref:IgGFc-binding protein n=1 Tax=Pseudenhygromyxa sp. WMMC2535 TaxID=2712867 RepID=UPI0015561FA5|nr:IgGFc-binding protein [Pseudenhygromyxa sp. WMMC2535]NVB36314.1 IgGFc-binding protein [Pseudenhygromyxa sp. WMMC2535]
MPRCKFVVLLTLGALPSLAACGDDGADTGADEVAPGSESSEEEATSADEVGTTDTTTDTSSSTTSEEESSAGESSESEEEEGGIKFDIANDSDLGESGLPPSFPETCAEAEATSTSVGCEFYPLALPGTQQTTGFMVSNVSDSVANVTLADKSGVLQQAAVEPGATHMFTDTGLHKMNNSTELGEDGYVIESDQVLQVFQYMPPDGTSTADASIVLPGPALGERHRVVTYNVHNNNTWQYAVVVATEDDTEVSFTLAQPFSQTLAGGPFEALDYDMGMDTLAATLDRLDTMLIVGHWENGEELNEFSASVIESDKPVAVYSGKQLANIPEGQCCADLIATSVPPTSIYGTEYAGVRFLPVGQPGKYDIWRVIGDQDGTVIELTGDHEDTLMLDAGEFVDIATGDVFWAKGNKAFGLTHFMTAGSLLPQPFVPYDCADQLQSPGDPAVGWVYPEGNWLNRYLFSPGTGSQQWCHDHVTIVAALDQWDLITMDGEALPEPTPIGGDSNHGYVYVPVPNASHEIEAPANVGVEVLVYGYVSHGSYFYPGGVGLQQLNPQG